MCIDIMESWFGIANRQFRQIFTELSARDTIMAGYYSLTVCLLMFVLTILAQRTLSSVTLHNNKMPFLIW